MSLFFCEDTGMLLVVRMLLSENRLGREVKKIAPRATMMEPNNISFDSDNNEDRENIDPSSQVPRSHHLMSGALQSLGNLTHKNNHHILNAIMRQADRQNLLETLGYPNRTVWIRDNLPIWFGTGGI